MCYRGARDVVPLYIPPPPVVIDVVQEELVIEETLDKSHFDNFKHGFIECRSHDDCKNKPS